MILVYELSMPNVGSWNGQWSGQNNYYATVVNYGRGKAKTELAQKILEGRYYHYNFGDGWSAGIYVKQVDAREAAKCRRKSKGFCGYEWMIESIENHGKITTDSGYG